MIVILIRDCLGDKIKDIETGGLSVMFKIRQGMWNKSNFWGVFLDN
jgi:hypothetical protein